MSQRTAARPPRTGGVTRFRSPATPAESSGWRLAVGRGWQLAMRRFRALAPDHAWRFTPPGAARLRVTARGALMGMFALCLVSDLVAAVLHAEVLIGLGFCAGCVLAPLYVRRQALLETVAVPPVTFVLAVVVVQVLTAQGNSNHASMLSVLEGTGLTLAAIAPWLFAGTALCLVIAMCRGLPQALRDLGAELRGQASPK